MTTSIQPDVVADPVSHISISGVHGRDELDRRRRQVTVQDAPAQVDMLLPLLIGAALGATVVYLLRR